MLPHLRQRERASERRASGLYLSPLHPSGIPEGLSHLRVRVRPAMPPRSFLLMFNFGRQSTAAFSACPSRSLLALNQPRCARAFAIIYLDRHLDHEGARSATWERDHRSRRRKQVCLSDGRTDGRTGGHQKGHHLISLSVISAIQHSRKMPSTFSPRRWLGPSKSLPPIIVQITFCVLYRFDAK